MLWILAPTNWPAIALAVGLSLLNFDAAAQSAIDAAPQNARPQLEWEAPAGCPRVEDVLRMYRELSQSSVVEQCHHNRAPAQCSL